MKNLCYILLMLTLLNVSNSFSQQLDSYRWKNRLVLILVDDMNSSTFKKQMKLLKKNLDELKERKVIVYKITTHAYLKGLESEDWIINKKFYQQSKKTKENFEIVVIGLDGDVKLRQTEILSTKKLFTLIDGMPMRRLELRN